MDILSAAVISFVGAWLLLRHVPKSLMRKILGYKGWVDIVLHASILYMFFGTSTLGLIQAELCGIFLSIYLRAAAKLGGYERRVNGKWMRYPGVLS